MTAGVPDRPSSPSPGPFERWFQLGTQALTEVELLSILLAGDGPLDDPSVCERARRLFVTTKLDGLAKLEARDVIGLFDQRSTATLLAAIELGRRLAKRRMPKQPLEDYEALVGYLKLQYGQVDQEVVGVLSLDLERRLLDDREIFRGPLTRASIEPRAILREALRIGAPYLVLFYAYPGSSPTPGDHLDREIARTLHDAAELVGIAVVEHLVFNSHGQWERRKTVAGP